jgi:uncharacterized protein (TIGR03000 family)
MKYFLALVMALLPAVALADKPAIIEVSTPPAAEVFFGNSLMGSIDGFGRYESPPLAPGANYTYEITVWYWNWKDGIIEETQKVTVRAGETTRVRFVDNGPPKPVTIFREGGRKDFNIPPVPPNIEREVKRQKGRQ